MASKKCKNCDHSFMDDHKWKGKDIVCVGCSCRFKIVEPESAVDTGLETLFGGL